MVVSLGVALVGFFSHTMWIGWCGVIAAVATAIFFRNPRRTIPQSPGLIVSPADGKVIGIEERDDPFFGRGRMHCVTIFLSVLNVHINRMPFDGRVASVQYIPGKYLLAFHPKASAENERNAVHITGTALGEEAVIVQIAGLIARRIISYLTPGDPVSRGMRYGLIRFGSRVDLYLPRSATLHVRMGDRVQGGATTIGAFA